MFSLSGMKQQIQDMQALITTTSLQHRILRQLIFEEMGLRRNQILDADPDTCRWILDDSSDDSEDSEESEDESISDSDPSNRPPSRAG